ncbi:MAG: GGDEF domain-containing protein [bacterium]|nr:GGDEF domain-containing protein [bacterium]
MAEVFRSNDELTGLYNRRGFLALAQQQMKIAVRMKKEIHLIYADMDGMKIFNDIFGHSTGDQVLVEMARVLQNIFRESDIIGRIGGDEFVILAVNGGSNADIIMQRLEEGIAGYNLNTLRDCKLSASIGTASYEHGLVNSIEKLMERADQSMYEQKMVKKQDSLEQQIDRMETEEKGKILFI